MQKYNCKTNWHQRLLAPFPFKNILYLILTSRSFYSLLTSTPGGVYNCNSHRLYAKSMAITEKASNFNVSVFLCLWCIVRKYLTGYASTRCWQSCPLVIQWLTTPQRALSCRRRTDILLAGYSYRCFQFRQETCLYGELRNTNIIWYLLDISNPNYTMKFIWQVLILYWR